MATAMTMCRVIAARSHMLKFPLAQLRAASRWKAPVNEAREPREMREPKPADRRPNAADDADNFGSVAAADPRLSHIMNREDPDLADDGDGENEFRAKIADTMRPRPVDFEKRIRNLCKKRDLQGALNVLDEMKQERVHQSEGHFRPILQLCGREGYTKKAFELYTEYSTRRLDYSQGVLSDLFNACANSPYPEYALRRAKNLHSKMSDRGVVFADVVYHNVLKTYGRCGDVEAAFCAMDEMKAKRVPISVHTYCHLLQGCISDKASGFRHALLVYRKLLTTKNMSLDVYVFNLMVRAAKECEIGDESFAYDILLSCMSVQEAQKHRQALTEASKELPTLGTGTQRGVSADGERQSSSGGSPSSGVAVVTPAEVKKAAQLPNLLDRKPDFRFLVGISAVATPQDRFALMGGLNGFCSVMAKHKVTPDVKTFSMMLSVIEDTTEAESSLLDKMDSLGVKPDIDFFNQLIKRRAKRRDFETGLNTIATIHERGLSVDLFTFGTLAMCCQTPDQGRQLLRDMDERQTRPNVEIFTTLLNNAFHRGSIRSVLELLKDMDRRGVTPTTHTLTKLEAFHKRFRDAILSVERNPETLSSASKVIQNEVKHGFPSWSEFCKFYPEYLKRTKVAHPEHPWKQFLTDKELREADRDKRIKTMIQEGPEGYAPV